MVSLGIVAAFVVPAILQGEPPVLVAFVGSMAIMFATVALAHGVDPKSAAALLGTTAALALTVVLAVVFVELTQITGFSSEEATLLKAGTFGRVSPQGLVLAGIVIGALGVLDDVTVSQASTVMALRRANPAQGVAELYRRALEVGRDHIAATVNTLVLAYVGAALPILLIFSNQQTSFGEAVNREPVAEQIVATLVGSIGLIAAVPLTTLMAALLAVRLPPRELHRRIWHRSRPLTHARGSRLTRTGLLNAPCTRADETWDPARRAGARAPLPPQSLVFPDPRRLRSRDWVCIFGGGVYPEVAATARSSTDAAAADPRLRQAASRLRSVGGGK